jgi:hypothetical protein
MSRAPRGDTGTCPRTLDNSRACHPHPWRKAVADGFPNRQVLDTTAKAAPPCSSRRRQLLRRARPQAQSPGRPAIHTLAQNPSADNGPGPDGDEGTHGLWQAGSRLSQSAAAKNNRTRRVDARSKPAFDLSSNKASCGYTMPRPIQLGRIFEEVVA